MAKKPKIKYTKIKSCLPFTHSYKRAWGSGVRMYVTCSKCGKTKSA